MAYHHFEQEAANRPHAGMVTKGMVTKAYHHFEQEAANRPHVALRAVGFVPADFRREVVRRACAPGNRGQIYVYS